MLSKLMASFCNVHWNLNSNISFYVIRSNFLSWPNVALPTGTVSSGVRVFLFFVIFCVMYSCVFFTMMTTPNTYPCTIPSCLFCFNFGLFSFIASYIQALAYCKDLRYPPPRSSNRAYTNARSTLSRTNSTSAAGDSNKGRNSRYTIIWKEKWSRLWTLLVW